MFHPESACEAGGNTGAEAHLVTEKGESQAALGHGGASNQGPRSKRTVGMSISIWT